MARGRHRLLRALQPLLGLAQIAGGAILLVLRRVSVSLARVTACTTSPWCNCCRASSSRRMRTLLGIGGLFVGLGLARVRLGLAQRRLGLRKRLGSVVAGPRGAQPGQPGVVQDGLVIFAPASTTPRAWRAASHIPRCRGGCAGCSPVPRPAAPGAGRSTTGRNWRTTPLGSETSVSSTLRPSMRCSTS